MLENCKIDGCNKKGKLVFKSFISKKNAYVKKKIHEMKMTVPEKCTIYF